MLSKFMIGVERNQYRELLKGQESLYLFGTGTGFFLPGIPIPVSEFPVHVPVPKKYARIPVSAKIPGSGSTQPLVYEGIVLKKAGPI